MYIVFSDAPLDSILKTRLFCDVLNIASIPLTRDLNSLNSNASNKHESPLIEHGSIEVHEQANYLLPMDILTSDHSNGSIDVLSTSSGYASGGTSLSNGERNSTKNNGINFNRKNRLNSRVTKVKKATLMAKVYLRHWFL